MSEPARPSSPEPRDPGRKPADPGLPGVPSAAAALVMVFFLNRFLLPVIVREGQRTRWRRTFSVRNVTPSAATPFVKIDR